jgi:predicted RNase H-like HicB family nuclease
MRYTVVLLPDAHDGGFVAYVPAIPGCVTQGETIDEALEMAADAAGMLLAELEAEGEVVPEEAPGAVVATIDVAVAASVPA